VKISFIDSGKGIDEVIQDKILQPFFSTKTINGISGSGFGLNISNKIIEAHSGTFSLDRHYKHTKFDITLPLISDSLNG
jgi:signal transduction histidine kinase